MSFHSKKKTTKQKDKITNSLKLITPEVERLLKVVTKNYNLTYLKIKDMDELKKDPLSKLSKDTI